MEEIIDRSGNLSIFTKKFETDYELLKWKNLKITKEIMDPYISRKEDKKPLGILGDVIESYKTSKDQELREININDLKEIDYELFQSLSAKKLNVLVSLKKFENKQKLFDVFFESTGDLDTSEPRNNVSDFLVSPTDERKSGGIFSRLFKRKSPQTAKIVIEEKEEAELDILKFFSAVKLEAKKEIPIYVERIAGYIRAIRSAQEMGQQALVDKLIGGIFLVKYESLLKVSGFEKKISESTLVNFIKKTEKGINLCYIKNFTRPVPPEVLEVKKKADSLEVFDNYAILFYDPKGKIYSETKEEKEKERQKKADPILFGMIEGSRNLYYITDWIDEYCDLTLDKFIETVGIKKENLTIEDKIRL